MANQNGTSGSARVGVVGELPSGMGDLESCMGSEVKDSKKYMVLVVEDEHEARQMVSEFSDEGKAFIRRSAKACREMHPERTHCECFCCSMFRWMD